MSFLKSAALVSAVSLSGLIAYNINWEYLWKRKMKNRKLPLIKQQAHDDAKSISVVLIPGEWHSPTYYEQLQEFLAEDGYTSYAVDLLPQDRLLRGGFISQMVQDLELALSDIPGKFILMGHSQGGLLAQACLERSQQIQEKIAGLILLGSHPLGLRPPSFQKNFWKKHMFAILQQTLFGTIRDKGYAKDLFLLPSTDETDEEHSKYLTSLIQAPSDGWTSTFHPFLSKPPSSPITKPSLILGAQDDVVYPPSAAKNAFSERFSKATHVTIPNQAHGFCDGEWEISLMEPLVDWLDEQSMFQDSLQWTKLVKMRKSPAESSK